MTRTYSGRPGSSILFSAATAIATSVIRLLPVRGRGMPPIARLNLPMPTLTIRVAEARTAWQRVTVADWYGAGDKVVEIRTGTAVWRHAGLPVVPIRWVLLRDPAQRFEPQALLCADLGHGACVPCQPVASTTAQPIFTI
ncbi:hypothetical protein M0638_23540 [Roseomonas sp. NAR14]|uniref:Uncharacterized protein n=1 Tax=Roseomonas acroporae TaxID=2937791 RepID=A0A9X2BYV4_9PROT|nr:hypothetical protein [Roseomonas acroporae]MCK8787349.1 hypothetical protein [Roseomonas acroporae]